MSQWIDWAKQLQAISQAGQAYSKDTFDIERFDAIEKIANQMFATLSNESVAKVEKLFIPESGYPTPKIDLRAGVIKDNKILLVHERSDNGWSLPGGWADVCETPSEGIIREVLEESGFVVNNPRLVAIKDRSIHPYQPEFPFHIYKLFFLCDLVSGEAKPNIEISAIDFFDRDNIPTLSHSRVLGEDIDMLFCYSNSSGLPVLVD